MAKRALIIAMLFGLVGCGGMNKRRFGGSNVKMCTEIAMVSFSLHGEMPTDGQSKAWIDSLDVTATDGEYSEKLSADFYDPGIYQFTGPVEREGEFHVVVKDGSTVLYDETLSVKSDGCHVIPVVEELDLFAP